eukprot:CAMPEP_0171730626 /NCGR_PEP_ID=MMETSP0991-20121206/28406_1 /TAXON_ID=483369 /ORGANISM="non described non described, Strain CCMP2098" /LENGTH=242 /DNA_ID=CAMNT_0012325401 /DNA_START=32 /DNA_END=760 /DNA_ORIENTATION=+
MDEDPAKLESQATTNGLSTNGYHYAHGNTYYTDGRICEPPQAVAADEGECEVQASQSKWNFKDYHWEERDILPIMKQRLSKRLVATELWRDKKSGDCLAVTSCDIIGWAVSNVRKGTTKNVWEFEATVTFDGTRGDTQLRVIVTAPGLDHELLVVAEKAGTPVALPEFTVSSQAGANITKKKAVDEAGNFIEVATGEVDAERTMRNNEMFLKLVKKKGLPLVQESLVGLLTELISYGQQPDE